MIPIADIPALAARFHRFGAFHQAESLYRQAVESHPADGRLWAGLGRVVHSLGRPEEAAAHFRQALSLDPHSVELRTELGDALTDLSRLDEAFASYQEALRLEPGDPKVHAKLGNARMRQGDPGAAATCYRQALALLANDPVVLFSLGDALIGLGEREGAADCYRAAVQIRPELAPAWFNLGRVLGVLGQPDEAAECYAHAVQLRPDDPGPLSELAALMMNRGALDQAVAAYEQVLQLQPDCAAAYSNMGLALLALGRLEDARLCFEQALYLRPDLAEVHNNLGLALLNDNRVREARLSFEDAIRIRPDLADAHNNLGLAWDALGQPDTAMARFDRAVQIDPSHIGALTNLGNACKDQGRAETAISFYRKALAATPDAAQVYSNLLLAMQYREGADPREMLAEARQYARLHADPLAAEIEPRRTRPPSGRRLRIGYVSSDFREHPVACFLEPILACHDHRDVEVVCYADVRQPDSTTLRLQAYADAWHWLVGLSDGQAATLIRQHELDILVDLAGHTGGNRLLVFARKPAAIQVSYLGYLGTTGLSAMDYYVTDAHADPPGIADAYYQEQLIRLSECAFCYDPGEASEVRPEPPVCQSGQVTFGCLNNPAKSSGEVLTLWSRLLAVIPGARLMLRAGSGCNAEERARQILTSQGVAPDRLLFAGPMASRLDYLNLYRDIDVALDPFPYNGVTTTADALWMGVPVVSLAGQMGASRQGVRFLRSVGMDELLAETPGQYVRIASELAVDVARLAALRATLRERMRRSPLLDARRLARDLEAVFRDMCQNPVSAQPR